MVPSIEAGERREEKKWRENKKHKDEREKSVHLCMACSGSQISPHNVANQQGISTEKQHGLRFGHI